MSTYTQTNRPVQVESTFGANALLVEHFSGEEALSTPFEYVLDCLSENPGLDGKKAVRSPIGISIELPSGGKRFIHGVVSRFAHLGRDTTFTRYRLEVVPALWFGTQRTNNRVFQKLSIPEIAEKVLKELKVDYKLEIVGQYKKRDMVVQYRESDFAFLSRLLEEEGVFYFFRHFKDQHLVVMADSPSAVKPGAVKKLPMALSTDASASAREMVLDLRSEHQACPGKYSVADYNELEPSNRLLSTNAGAQSGLEQFDSYARFATKDEGDRIARLRMEYAQALQDRIAASSNCSALSAGYRLDVDEHPVKSINTSYTLVRVAHSASQPVREGDTGAFQYSNSFVAIPHSVHYRPPIVTPKPRASTQPAVVVGPQGEEIHTDKYGRVKVQFFWDREGKRDENSSIWVRVAQPTAGKGWGYISIPRVGQEVLVDFIEGDPDRPVIVGRVYNAEQMPPFLLPEDKTQTGLKSRSTPQGDGENFSELSFEDKKGQERVYFRAEKDLWTSVENDEEHWVGHDLKSEIHHDETRTVKEGDQTLKIEKGKQTETIHGDRTVTIQTGNDKLTVSTGGRKVIIDQGNDELTVNMGNMTMKVPLGKVATEAMQEIEMKVGQSSVKIDQMGVTIKGMMISIDGQIQTQVKGMMTEVSGSAMLQARGGLTMIN
jgi:type VI secretion system secreted protein VgrG